MTNTLLKREFKKIDVDRIYPNPNQPRKVFDEVGIEELAKSIGRYGVITPLTVRKTSRGYELVAGERRLRASKKAGVRQVPCYILEVGEQESSLMAIVENLQRKDLDFFEEALSLRCLIEKYGLTQQETAEKIGKTQSAVANKLRLLKLSPDTVKLIRERGLSERHARTLLRLDEEQQFFAAEIMSASQMNVQQAEEYVDNLLLERVKTDKTPQKEGKKRKNPIVFVKDLRIFNNSLMRSIEIMRSSGLDVKYKREQKDGLTVYTVTVPDGVKAPKNVSRETL